MYSPFSNKRKAYLELAWLAVAGGAIEFILRALVRANRLYLSDLAFPYVSARLWLNGANPYDKSLFFPTWFAHGATRDGLPNFVMEAYSVYPPPTLIPMLPFALLRWPSAVHLFLVCGLILYAAAVYGLFRLGWPRHQWRVLGQEPLAVFFLAFALGLAPIHSAFNSQNIVLFAACTAILSICLLGPADRSQILGNLHQAAPKLGARCRPFFAGAAVTLALCLKPTTGICLLPWLIRERRWRLIAGVIAACAILTAVSMAPLFARHGTSWLVSYRANVAYLFTEGGNADVSHVNPENTDNIDLQLPLFALLNNRSLSSMISLAVYAGLMVPLLYSAGWSRKETKFGRSPDIYLLVAAGSLTIGLLPVYSRIYSAIVVLPLVMWCLQHLRFTAARWMLFLLCDFLVNSSAIVRTFFSSTALAKRMPHAWDATIGGHTCWLLLVIGFFIVQAMRQQSRELVMATGPA